MGLTLADARRLFRSYAGTGNDFTDRINQVVARLLPEGNFKGTKVRMRFAVYVDANGNNIITLPPDIEAVLAGAYEPNCDGSTGPTGPCFAGRTLPVRNGWFEFSASGPGNMKGTNPLAGIIPLEGRYTVFQDWNTAMKMRIKPERDESPGGTIIFRGISDNEKVFSSQNGTWLEGFGLDYTTTATVTSTQTIDSPPYQIIKPITRGRLRLYAVDEDDNETLVGDFAPNETSPSYTRYKVPSCSNAP